jgi:transcriptional regulator with GAF, ATPase, and Fis domain
VRGEAIPIGARILSVVDCYDALTSDRPYRRAMTDDAALEILRERRGTMYDPHVVDTFVSMYRRIELGETDRPEQRDVLRRISESRTDAAAPAESSVASMVAPAPSSVASEVLAFVNLSRIASGEARVADIVALSANLLANLAPDATGAFYLLDSARDRLNVADAFGPAAHLLRGRSVGVGQRLSGWVAASRQAMVNADATLDLEDLVERAAPPLCGAVSVPLLMGESLVGVLTLYSPRRDAGGENRSRIVQMIAPHIASALQAATRAEASRSEDKSGERPAARELRLVRR